MDKLSASWRRKRCKRTRRISRTLRSFLVHKMDQALQSGKFRRVVNAFKRKEATMKKTLMRAAAIAMLVGAACGGGQMSDAKPMTDAEIIERKASMSKEFAAIETLIK